MNFTSVNLLITLNIFLFVWGCSNKPVNENEAVNKVIYKLIEADNKSDIQTVLNSYKDSVEFYPAGKEYIHGIRNVRVNYEKLFKDNRLSLTLKLPKQGFLETLL